MSYKMSQLDYLAAENILVSEHDAKSREQLLESMDASEWRTHPVYGCIHKDLFFVIDALAGVVEITEHNVELSDNTLAAWEEGRKTQTFQTHEAS